MISYSRVYAAVDLDAILSNVAAMKASLPPSTGMMGVVKADGYGHGAVPVARAIEPYVEGFAVASIDEGMTLRKNGIKKRILILGTTHESRFMDLIRYQICPAMFRYEEAERLSALAEKQGVQVPIHLALDTGMSRIGMRPDRESAQMVKEMSRLSGICLEGLFTHFSRADETDKSVYEAQFQAYKQFLGYLAELEVTIPIRHCSNSAGIVEALEANELDLVRAGIAMYGLYPSDEVDHQGIRLKPAMSLKSFITYIKTIEPGTAVSYGGTFVADRKMRVATIPVGYADGYIRSLSNKASVLIRGKRARILGRICMDQFMVDVTEIPEAREDDTVTLVGRDGEDEITIEELAELGGGFHYEIICGISKRVPRVYLRFGEILMVKDCFDEHYE